VYQPLLITKDKTIIAGHRRHAAAKQVGIGILPALVFHSDDELDIKAALVEANKQRAKTNEQIGREFNVLKEVEEARAKKRMEAGRAVAPGDRGKARDKAAAKIGDISGFSAERAGAVVKVIEELGDGDLWATKYRRLLSKNITAAYDKAVAVGHIKTKGKKDAQNRAAAGKKAAATKKQNAAEKGGADADAPNAAAARAGVDDNSGADTDGAPDAEYDNALEAADNAETFLRSKAATKLDEAQKEQWKKVVENMVKLLAALGVKVSMHG
jgi:ParB-like chromosome segregation protein Spo0J